MDLYNNEILTCSIISDSPNLEFFLKLLETLLEILPKTTCKQLLHTDQSSWQFKLKKACITTNMSCRATCLEHACIESYFNQLKAKANNLQQSK